MTAQTETVSSDPLSAIGEALESAAGSINEASSSAAQSAKAAAQSVKGAAHAGTYNLAYGLSYGIVFGAVFLVELLPDENVLRRGFEDGAEAGFDSAVEKSNARRAKRRTTADIEDEFSAPAAEQPANTHHTANGAA